MATRFLTKLASLNFPGLFCHHCIFQSPKLTKNSQEVVFNYVLELTNLEVIKFISIFLIPGVSFSL